MARRPPVGYSHAVVSELHDVREFLAGRPPFVSLPDAALEALRSADALVLIDTHRSPLEGLASVVFAARVAAEKHGTLSNHAGRVQRVVPAVEPPFEAHAEGEIVWRLAQALDLPGFAGDYDVRAVSKDLAEAEPAFAGRDLDSLPPEGAPLRGARVD